MWDKSDGSNGVEGLKFSGGFDRSDAAWDASDGSAGAEGLEASGGSDHSDGGAVA